MSENSKIEVEYRNMRERSDVQWAHLGATFDQERHRHRNDRLAALSEMRRAIEMAERAVRSEAEWQWAAQYAADEARRAR